PDLEDSGLLTIPENTLKIGEALGATMTATLDSLTAVTSDVVEGAQVLESEVEEDEEEAEEVVETVSAPAQAPAGGSGTLKIHIGEGKDINLEIPMGYGGSAAGEQPQAIVKEVEGPVAAEEGQEDKKVRELVKKHYQID